MFTLTMVWDETAGTWKFALTGPAGENLGTYAKPEDAAAVVKGMMK